MLKVKSKFRREIGRLFRRIWFMPNALFDKFFSTFYYDHVLSRNVALFEGLVQWQDKVAIFLIYPKDGINVGHIEALKYMISVGYSPLVVSNHPLADQEVAILLPLASRILVRPNFGYDFGGYRDGVRSVRERRGTLQHLALFNDSVWFPLPDSQEWLSSAERMRVDFAGALSHAGPDWREALEFAVEGDKRKRRYDRLLHFCSFALLFSGNALKSDRFWMFWDRLPISSSKARTVKNGERGLSKFMFEEGFSHALSITNDDIAYKLRQVAPDLRSSEVRQFEESGGWPAYSLAQFLWKEHGFMFLKKKAVNGEPLAYLDGLEATVERFSRRITITGDDNGDCVGENRSVTDAGATTL